MIKVLLFAMATSETSDETRINTGFLAMGRLNLHLFYTEWRILPEINMFKNDI